MIPAPTAGRVNEVVCGLHKPRGRWPSDCLVSSSVGYCPGGFNSESTPPLDRIEVPDVAVGTATDEERLNHDHCQPWLVPSQRRRSGGLTMDPQSLTILFVLPLAAAAVVAVLLLVRRRFRRKEH
jgi:hypothetical protein